MSITPSLRTLEWHLTRTPPSPSILPSRCPPRPALPLLRASPAPTWPGWWRVRAGGLCVDAYDNKVALVGAVQPGLMAEGQR
jgi:hypothetical protein